MNQTDECNVENIKGIYKVLFNNDVKEFIYSVTINKIIKSVMVWVAFLIPNSYVRVSTHRTSECDCT